MRKQSGFTLIELVVVIVILGILAATAAPKFMDLQKDARESALNGMAGAMKSAISMTYSKAILAGKDKQTKATYVCASGAASSSCEGTPNAIEIIYGRPTATQDGIVLALSESIDEKDTTGSSADWFYVKNVKGDNTIGIYQKNSTPVSYTSGAAAGCGIIYTQSTGANINPVIEVVTTDC